MKLIDLLETATEQGRQSFDNANKKVHPVEKQWHYPIMTDHGYVADTKEGIGFVRTYHYTNPTTKHKMSVTTGARADYWTDGGKQGYWGDLDPHLVAKGADKDVVKESQANQKSFARKVESHINKHFYVFDDKISGDGRIDYVIEERKAKYRIVATDSVSVTADIESGATRARAKQIKELLTAVGEKQ